MAVFAFVSASGSPGVTTTVVGLALVWPRPCLLLEADPTGGSALLAGYFRGGVPHDAGVVDLAFAHRQGTLADALPQVSAPFPGRDDARFIAGIRAHTQAGSLTGVWQPVLAELCALEDNGQDVLVDAGRLGLTGSPAPLVEGADVTVLVTRTDLPALATARSWAATLSEQRVGMPTGIALIGPGRPYGAREVGDVLDLPVMGGVAWDPDDAGVFARGVEAPRRFDSSKYVRSLRTLADALRGEVPILASTGPRASEVVVP